jgi:hypothetical protein
VSRDGVGWVEINYFEILRSYNEFMIAKQVGAKANSLFRVMLDKANTLRFPETMAIFNSELLDLSGLTKDELYPARNRLTQIKINSQPIIIYINNGTHKPGGYKINFKGFLSYFQGYSENPTKVPTKPTTKPQTKPKNKDPDEISSRPFIIHYQEQFQSIFGETPVIIWAKDSSNVKRLLRTYGEDKLKGLLSAFFESDDPFIKKSGYTLGVFSTCINKLLINNKSLKDLKDKAVGKDVASKNRGNPPGEYDKFFANKTGT